jgi:small subunit ribosomal protein S4
MGDIKRKRRLFSKPRKLYDKARIEDENKIVLKYGLKSKREIWKAQAKVSDLRSRAKALIPQSEKKKQEFFGKLNKMGLKAESISDVLALRTENWLDRRLQTIVFSKGMAKTAKQSRQLIAHKQVLVNGKAVSAPSFFVPLGSENKIELKVQKAKPIKETVEVKEDA